MSEKLIITESELKINRSIEIVNALRFAGANIYRELGKLIGQLPVSPQIERFNNISGKINQHHRMLYTKLIELIEDVRTEAINARNDEELWKEHCRKLKSENIALLREKTLLLKDIENLKSHDIRLTHA